MGDDSGRLIKQPGTVSIEHLPFAHRETVHGKDHGSLVDCLGIIPEMHRASYCFLMFRWSASLSESKIAGNPGVRKTQ